MTLPPTQPLKEGEPQALARGIQNPLEVPFAIFGRDESVRIEWRHQRLRRFVFGRSLQTKAVDVVGLNTWWVQDCIDLEAASWWGAAAEEAKDAPQDEDQLRTRVKRSGGTFLIKGVPS